MCLFVIPLETFKVGVIRVALRHVLAKEAKLDGSLVESLKDLLAGHLGGTLRGLEGKVGVILIHVVEDGNLSLGKAKVNVDRIITESPTGFADLLLTLPLLVLFHNLAEGVVSLLEERIALGEVGAHKLLLEVVEDVDDRVLVAVGDKVFLSDGHFVINIQERDLTNFKI